MGKLHVSLDQPTPKEIERLFLQGHSIPDICNRLNLSIDVVEDAIRDQLKDWKFKARENKKLFSLRFPIERVKYF